MHVQGLGEELAHYFASHGARLILSSRKEEQLQVGFHIPLIEKSNFFTPKQGLLLLFKHVLHRTVQTWQRHNYASQVCHRNRCKYGELLTQSNLIFDLWPQIQARSCATGKAVPSS